MKITLPAKPTQPITRRSDLPAQEPHVWLTPDERAELMRKVKATPKPQ